jgi:hypothetical protein
MEMNRLDSGRSTRIALENSDAVKRGGDCYRQAFNLLSERHFAGDRDWKLCHGIVIGTGATNFGKPCGHAWLEKRRNWVVLDASGRLLKMGDFYRAGHIKVADVKRFTFKQAMVKAEKTQVYGPWNRAIDEAERWIGSDEVLHETRNPAG